MSIHALYRKPCTSKRYAKHPVYPYLLDKPSITRSNHMVASDITYIPKWRLSNTLTTDFCIDAVQSAINRY